MKSSFGQWSRHGHATHMPHMQTRARKAPTACGRTPHPQYIHPQWRTHTHTHNNAITQTPHPAVTHMQPHFVLGVLQHFPDRSGALRWVEPVVWRWRPVFKRYPPLLGKKWLRRAPQRVACGRCSCCRHWTAGPPRSRRGERAWTGPASSGGATRSIRSARARR